MQLVPVRFGMLVPDPKNFIPVGIQAGERGLLKFGDDFFFHRRSDDFVRAETQNAGGVFVFEFDGVNQFLNPVRVTPHDHRKRLPADTLFALTACQVADRSVADLNRLGGEIIHRTGGLASSVF